MKPIEALLVALDAVACKPKKSGAKWAAKCPAHEDRAASLGLGEFADGGAWVRCHAGCDKADVLASLNMTNADLQPAEKRKVAKPIAIPGAKAWPTLDRAIEAARRSVAKTEPEAVEAGRWEYVDARGAAVGAVVRFDFATPAGEKKRKTFRPLHRVAAGWALGDPAGPWPLYRLVTLAGAKRVYVCEGEKAADAAAGCGLVVTTSAHGAQSPEKTDWKPLASAAEVIILPDNDEAGEGYARRVAALVRKVNPAAVVKVLRLPDLPDKGDFADFSEMRDGQDAEVIKAEIEALAESADAMPRPTDTDTTAPGGGKNGGSVSNAMPYRSFPTDILPEPLASLVRQGAVAIGCDEAFIALPLLATCGAAIGNARTIVLKKGWTEPPLLWVAVVAESGSHKTPAFDLAMQSMRGKENAAYRRWQGAMSTYSDELDAWEQLQKPKGKGSRGGDVGKKPVEPVAERYIVSDATMEALADRLRDNPRGLLLAVDELGGWLKGFDQYRNGKGNDLQRWLSIHSAGAVKVDRKIGPTKHIHIPRAFVSVCGTIQPGVLSRAMTAEFEDAGLSPRLLYAAPPDRVNRWTEATVSAATLAAVDAMTDALLALAMVPDADGEMGPVALPLAMEALAEWRDFHDRHAEEQAAMSGRMRAVWAKLQAAAARLALIVHCVRVAGGEADGEAVDLASMRAGIGLAEWFGYEALRCAGAAETPEQAKRRELVEAIRKMGGEVTPRDLQRGGPCYATASQAMRELDALAIAQQGRWTKPAPSEKGGRPADVFKLDNLPSTDTTPTGDAETGVVSPSVTMGEEKVDRLFEDGRAVNRNGHDPSMRMPYNGQDWGEV